MQLGILSPAELEAAVARQRADGRRLGEMLVAEDRITREQLAQALAKQLGLKAFDLTDGIDPRLAGLIDERTARRLQAVPVRVDADGRLVVAMADPGNLLALDDLRILTGREIRPEVATHEDVGTLIGSTNQFDAVMADLVPDEGHFDAHGGASDVADAADDAPVVRLVNSLIARAVEERASDIHFEPQAAEMTVRYRVDGVLRQATALPMRLAGGVASRIKIMADLDIAEKRVPQDGRVSLNVGGRPLDLRVATLPTVHGEKVVIRVLDKTNVLMHLTEMGFAADVLRAYESAYQRPFGAVLVTGPTGSGKSTTLYGTLNQLNSIERNIITVEDPVEYRLPGINQVQVNPRAGLTFATGLRSILRLGPRRGDDRRGARPRDRPDRDRVGADRPPGAGDAAHQRLRRRAHPPLGDGRRAVPVGQRDQRRAGPAAGPPALPELQGARHDVPGAAAVGRRRAGAAGGPPGPRADLHRGGLRALRRLGLPGPARVLRDAPDDRVDPEARHRRRLGRGDRPPGAP